MPSAAKEVGRPRSCASWAQPSARAQGEEGGREGNMIGDSSLERSRYSLLVQF